MAGCCCPFGFFCILFPKLLVALGVWDSGFHGLLRRAKQEPGSLKLLQVPLLCIVQTFNSGQSSVFFFLSPRCWQRSAFVVFLQLSSYSAVVSKEVLQGSLSEQLCGFISYG